MEKRRRTGKSAGYSTKAPDSSLLMVYLTLTRMKKAVLLLRKDPLKIYELAYLVGYNDAHYFSNLFKKITGKSPSAYKRELSIEQQHQGGEHEGN